MKFIIVPGVPEFENMWNRLLDGYRTNSLSKEEQKILKSIGKIMKLLAENPRHNSLCSHEIKMLTKEYGFKIFQSYTQNNTPSAGRLFWAFGPNSGEITILGYFPHPENKKEAYKHIKLSGFPVRFE